jgi:AcrR family transcriptional regulator
MPQTSPPSRKKKRVLKSTEDRQREILDVTVQVLAEYGIQGATISRIADAVGMSKGALYYHFPNREALVSAAMDMMDEAAAAWLAELTGTDAPSSLLAMGDAHSDFTLSGYHSFIRPFFQTIASNPDEAVVSLITEKRDVYFDRLRECAERGKREGTIRADVDTREVAWAMLLHAWGEDVARLQGADEYIAGGFSRRILRRLLATYSVPEGPAAEG